MRLVRTALIATAALIGLPAAMAQAGDPPTLLVDPSSVETGGEFEVSGANWMCDFEYYIGIVIDNDLQTLGGATGDGNGNFAESFNAPETPGEYEIVVSYTNQNCPYTQSVFLTVTAPATTTTAGGDSGSRLPDTGSSTVPIVALASLALAGGVTLVARSRRPA